MMNPTEMSASRPSGHVTLSANGGSSNTGFFGLTLLAMFLIIP
jgi:hypothetical protein